MPDPRAVFIFEPHAGELKRTSALVEHLGYTALGVASTEDAPAVLEEEPLAAILIAHSAEGVELGQYIDGFTALRAPICAVVGEKEKAPEKVVQQMKADGYLRRPCTTSTLETFIALAPALLELRRRNRELEQTLSEAEGRLREVSVPATGTGFHSFDAVKDLLVIEVRRAKRYGYPLSVLMVGLDPLPAVHELQRPSLQRDITGGLAVAIAKSVRAIDLPIQYAPDRILVFLPHTDLAGAEEVGRRIKRRIKRITYRGPGLTAQLTASVGVAGLGAGDTLTFSKLIRSASAALKAAQLKGGDRVMKRTSAS